MATDRYLDLLKQGFMKPRRAKRVTLYQVWLPANEGMCYEGENEITARLLAAKYAGEVKQVRKTL